LARVNEGSHSFTCNPATRLSTTAFYSQSWSIAALWSVLSVCPVYTVQYEAELAWVVACYIPKRHANAKTVTDPSANQIRRLVTQFFLIYAQRTTSSWSSRRQRRSVTQDGDIPKITVILGQLNIASEQSTGLC